MTAVEGIPTSLESDSAVTGTFGVSLTRAVLPYSDPSDWNTSGGRIQDIGLGVVTDGADPARSQVLDLGSAESRVVNLAGPVAVLGWLYPSGLRDLRKVVEGLTEDRLEVTRSLTFQMALRVLKGVGFGPLTRPTLLRIGFRDLCQDLDLHERTAVRLLLPEKRGVVRIHLDYESTTLIVRTGRMARSIDVEVELLKAFPQRECLRGRAAHSADTAAYHVPFATPRSHMEIRDLLRTLRSGLAALLARFDPDRHRTQNELSLTFGERDSLRSLREPKAVSSLEPVVLHGSQVGPGPTGVH